MKGALPQSSSEVFHMGTTNESQGIDSIMLGLAESPWSIAPTD